MTLRATIRHLTFTPVLLAPPRRPLDSGADAVQGMPSVAGITDGLAKATQEDENGGTPGGTTRGIASRVLGASNPRRNLFTLTSILSRQGRGGTPFGLAGHRWLGTSPALHLSFDPRLSLFGRRRLVSPAGAGIDPGSESGTCFRTKTGGGLASPPTPLDSRFRGNDEWEGIPTDAGMTRFENWVHWMMGGSGVVCATHATPGWGQAPALHSFLRPWAVVVRATVVGVAGRCRNSSRISPGHAFLPIYRGGIIEHIELFQILRVRTGTRSRSRQIRYQVTTTSVC